jgi:uncharacterized protein (DUF952 family)
VSVIFHIATGRDWERATSSGTYPTESMHRHGVIGFYRCQAVLEAFGGASLRSRASWGWRTGATAARDSGL